MTKKGYSMTKLDNLTGKRFGSLTVLARVEGAKRTTWRCQCDCGKQTDILATNLKQGLTTSCGCGAHAASVKRGKRLRTFVDLTGQRFGRLVAVSYDARRRKWLCQCDCGKTSLIACTYLTNGSRTDCGCGAAAEARRQTIRSGANGHALGTNINAIQHIMDGKLRTTNTSGATGIRVRHNQCYDTYTARITFCGKTVHLGTFATMESAIEARKTAEEKFFGAVLKEYKEAKNNAKD